MVDLDFLEAGDVSAPIPPYVPPCKPGDAARLVFAAGAVALGVWLTAAAVSRWRANNEACGRQTGR